MSTLRILGASDAAVAMLIEAWAAPGGNPAPLARVVVVQNVPVTPRVPYAPAGLAVIRVMHDETAAWRAGDAPTVLGAYRPAVKARVQRFFETRYAIGCERYAETASASADIASTVVRGPGAWIGPHAVLGPFTRLGTLVTINRGALVGHHVEVGDFATLGPGCIVGGGVRIGAGASIAMGAKVLEGLIIGDGAVVGAGAVVTRPVPPATLVHGVPARHVRALPREGAGGG